MLQVKGVKNIAVNVCQKILKAFSLSMMEKIQ